MAVLRDVVRVLPLHTAAWRRAILSVSLSVSLKSSLAVLEITIQTEVLAYSTEVHSPLKVLFSVSFNWIQHCTVLTSQETVFCCMILTDMYRYMVNPAIWWAEMPLYVIQVGAKRSSEGFVWLHTQNMVCLRPENQRDETSWEKNICHLHYICRQIKKSPSELSTL